MYFCIWAWLNLFENFLHELSNRNVPCISLAASIQFSSSCFCFWAAVECFHLLLVYVVWLDAFPLWSKLWMSFLFPADFPVVVIFFSPTSPRTSVFYIIKPLGQRPAFPVGVPAKRASAWTWFSLLPFTGWSLHVRSVRGVWVPSGWKVLQKYEILIMSQKAGHWSWIISSLPPDPLISFFCCSSGRVTIWRLMRMTLSLSPVLQY